MVVCGELQGGFRIQGKGQGQGIRVGSDLSGVVVRVLFKWDSCYQFYLIVIFDVIDCLYVEIGFILRIFDFQKF